MSEDESGGSALVAQTVVPEGAVSADPAFRLSRLRLPAWLAALRANRRVSAVFSDVAAVLVAALDVWLVVPEGAPTYSIWLSWLAVPAMLLRRHVPFVAVLLTIPGFFAGWAQLAAMIALGTLAKRHLLGWRTIVGAVLVGLSRFVLWPWSEFLALTWRQHFLDVLYGVLVAGMPVAIGMLITVRQELSTRIRELARSREREKRLYAQTVRSAERAKLAREMHDVVSHQVTLIAMQAGALQVGAKDDESREAAETIRALSTRTLEELRELVGVLRSGGDDDTQPGLDEIADLMRSSGFSVALAMDAAPELLPAPVSRAAYRTVQEALTNVRKHAAGSRTSVRVRADGETLLVEVRNERPRTRPPLLPSGGHGLLGLRERAGLLGGSFDAGPTAEGGFQVRARYPLAG
ncbi:sensor histidine kinase [Actinokineospora sp.]|uniref:sensor histidine kinase n=1 Tax=Actinokineospora sp. TaxID=1872133 RepID=UPI004038339A